MHLLYIYCFFVGKDEFGKILSKKATEAGVNVNYLIHEKEPTGTCAVCITGKHRCSLHCLLLMYTAISRKVVGKNVHATIPKGNMGYDQFTVPDTVAVEPTFVTFL